MALTTADFYWTDTFKLIQQQTDREIQTYNQGSGSSKVFASSLVEPQRFLKQIRQSFDTRIQEVITVPTI